MRSKISSKLIFASCLWYSDRAHYELCVLIKDIGRRLPLQLQCSYQGQQNDFSQSVRGNYKTRFWGGQYMYKAMRYSSILNYYTAVAHRNVKNTHTQKLCGGSIFSCIHGAGLALRLHEATPAIAWQGWGPCRAWLVSRAPFLPMRL